MAVFSQLFKDLRMLYIVRLYNDSFFPGLHFHSKFHKMSTKSPSASALFYSTKHLQNIETRKV